MGIICYEIVVLSLTIVFKSFEYLFKKSIFCQFSCKIENSLVCNVAQNQALARLSKVYSG